MFRGYAQQVRHCQPHHSQISDSLSFSPKIYSVFLIYLCIFLLHFAKCLILLCPQDTQEFLRCLMDQLHEELKEPLTECSMSGEGSDGEDLRDGEQSPSEDEFLSCDSGSSSDRGEGGGAGESELLLQDECDGVWPPAGGTVGHSHPGGVISEKERLKEKRVSGSPLRGGSQEMDEDADVDTAAEETLPERAEEEALMPASNTESQSQETLQITDTGQGPTQSNTPGVRSGGFYQWLFQR